MTSEQYGIAGRQIALRRHALGRKIPQQIREQLQREVCTHLKSDQLHLQWDPNWFAASGDRLKHPLHLVVVAENGHEWFDAIFADLPFTHQLVSRPDGGSFGTFLCGKEALSLFLKGQPPKDTPYRDRHLHIDHACTDVTHTTLFLVFESESGELTNTLRNAFPEHQIATVVQGQQSASSCSAATTMVERGENGFRIGETLFLPNLSRHFPDQPLGDAAALFATIDLLVEIGLGERPPLATAAQRAASAMYGGSSP